MRFISGTELLNFEVFCPKCGKGKDIRIPNSLFTQKEFGTIKVKVPKGAVCGDHNFIVFITTKGKIVGYDIIDASISVEVPQSTPIENIKTSLDNLVNSFGFNCIAGLIHAKLFDYPSFIVRNEDLKVSLEELDSFLDQVIPAKFKNQNTLKDVEFDSYVFPNADYFYNMVKFKEKNAFLINNHRLIIQIPWEIDIEFEKSILNSALEKKSKIEQFNYLAYYISQFINDVDFTCSLLESSGTINEKDLMKKLKQKLIVSTINKGRIALIKEFLERRISPEISSRIN